MTWMTDNLHHLVYGVNYSEHLLRKTLKNVKACHKRGAHAKHTEKILKKYWKNNGFTGDAFLAVRLCVIGHSCLLCNKTLMTVMRLSRAESNCKVR